MLNICTRQCPKKHELTISNVNNNPGNEFICVVCSNKSKFVHWTCASCNYNVCKSCRPINEDMIHENKQEISIAVCNNQHQLTWIADVSGTYGVAYMCKKCGILYDSNVPRWICAQCNYNICKNCRRLYKPENKQPQVISTNFPSLFSSPAPNNPFLNSSMSIFPNQEESKNVINFPIPVFPASTPFNPNMGPPSLFTMSPFPQKPVVSDIEKFETLEREKFKQLEFADNLACQICSFVPNPQYAVSHECGKVFCKKCIDKWLIKSAECPNCRSTDKKYDTIGKLMKNTMMLLTISCPNPIFNSESCKWEGKWENLENHLKECQFTEVNCVNWCGAKFIRKNQENHEKNECIHRKTKCKFCEKEFRKSDIESHESDCEKNIDALIKCKFHEAGCDVVLKRKDMPEHYKTEYEKHGEIMLKLVEEYKTKVKFQGSVFGK